MKGDPKLIKVLNSLLADELTAINQYMVHSEMCANWGYGKLHKTIEKRAIDEMKHAEKLIGRILFLEGLPIVSELKKLFIGADVPEDVRERPYCRGRAIKSYNDAIILAGNVKDYATRDMLRPSSRTKTLTSTRSRRSRTRSARWACQIFLTTQVG